VGTGGAGPDAGGWRVSGADCCGEPRAEDEPEGKRKLMSAKAAGPEGARLTEEEIEAAEAEALEWARRVNRC